MKKPKVVPGNSSQLGREAKAIVALAFRNGPIENLHAGENCPTCHGEAKYSHITNGEMQHIMKAAVDKVYEFLVLKEQDPQAYAELLRLGDRYTTAWDEPV